MILNRLLAGLAGLSASALLLVGCIAQGPIVECTGSASYPCPNGTCAVSPDACPVDPGCPTTYPARCDQNFCATELGSCPGQPISEEQASAPGSPVVSAPAPTGPSNN